jgi:hypothetical protein
MASILKEICRNTVNHFPILCWALLVVPKKARLEKTFVANCKHPTNFLSEIECFCVWERAVRDFSRPHPFSGAELVSSLDTSSGP